MEEPFAQRHPCLLVALFVSVVVVISTAVTVLDIKLVSTPPEFSATVSGYEGLVRSADAGAAPPSFRVALHVKNNNVWWQHCFAVGRAVVEYDGVPGLAFPLLDGGPDLPSRCLLFFFMEPGRMDGE